MGSLKSYYVHDGDKKPCCMLLFSTINLLLLIIIYEPIMESQS